MLTEDENLDLVNENDEVIATMPRSEVYAARLSNFRVINAFIRNQEGKLWIPRRTEHKRIFPSCLDVSVGGHVEAGETYLQAFARETKEELNIDIAAVKWNSLGKLTPKQGLSAFMEVYEIQSDESPAFNTNDFTEFYWLTPQEVLDRLANGDKSKGDLPGLIQAFYF